MCSHLHDNVCCLPLINIFFPRFPPTAQELARDEAQFRAGFKKMTERERSKVLHVIVYKSDAALHSCMSKSIVCCLAALSTQLSTCMTVHAYGCVIP